MGGGSDKAKKANKADKAKKSSRAGKAKRAAKGSTGPATVVVDLHVDLRGLTVIAEGRGAVEGAGGARDEQVRPAGGPGRSLEADLAAHAGREPVLPAVGGSRDEAAGSTASRPHHAPADAADDDVDGPAGAGPAWPLGPHYLRWVEGKGADAWARFKLKSADWYLEALEVAEREVGLDRFVGVEMAIDGVLSSLCAGVDAAGHALLEEVERFSGPSSLRPHRPAGEDWTVLVGLAEGAGIELASARAILLALRGDDEEPDGWLAQLQRLRAQAVRRNVLVRRPNVDGAGRSRLLDVPGLGHRPVLRYLSRTRRRADGLVEAVLADVEALAKERLRPAPRAGRRGLPDLAKRADVLGARWHGTEVR